MSPTCMVSPITKLQKLLHYHSSQYLADVCQEEWQVKVFLGAFVGLHVQDLPRNTDIYIIFF